MSNVAKMEGRTPKSYTLLNKWCKLNGWNVGIHKTQIPGESVKTSI